MILKVLISLKLPPLYLSLSMLSFARPPPLTKQNFWLLSLIRRPASGKYCIHVFSNIKKPVWHSVSENAENIPIHVFNMNRLCNFIYDTYEKWYILMCHDSLPVVVQICRRSCELHGSNLILDASSIYIHLSLSLSPEIYINFGYISIFLMLWPDYFNYDDTTVLSWKY